MILAVPSHNQSLATDSRLLLSPASVPPDTPVGMQPAQQPESGYLPLPIHSDLMRGGREGEGREGERGRNWEGGEREEEGKREGRGAEKERKRVRREGEGKRRGKERGRGRGRGKEEEGGEREGEGERERERKREREREREKESERGNILINVFMKQVSWPYCIMLQSAWVSSVQLAADLLSHSK